MQMQLSNANELCTRACPSLYIGTYISKQWDPVSLECDLEATAPGLRVGAFNVRIFGVTKFSEADVVEILRLVRS